MSDILANTQATILDRAFGSIPSGMTAEAARFFLSLSLADSDKMRADELAAKSREGVLTVSEQQELDEYRRAGRMIETLRIRARSVVEPGSK